MSGHSSIGSTVFSGSVSAVATVSDLSISAARQGSLFPAVNKDTLINSAANRQINRFIVILPFLPFYRGKNTRFSKRVHIVPGSFSVTQND